MNLTKEIQMAVGYMFAMRGLEAVVENIGTYVGEIDVAAVSLSGLLHEVEVKISKSDYIADRKKQKWIHYENRIPKHCPNYFYYACPENLIDKNEIPDYAGLIYYVNGIAIQIKHPKRLHKVPAENRFLLKMLRIHTQRYFLGGCKMTVENKQAKERNLTIGIPAE